MIIELPFGNAHLTYCLNIHPGESWAENFAAIKKYGLTVRDRVAPGRAFGLGLRLGARAAEELEAADNLSDFRQFLEAERLYVFTINGFPYGKFHGASVKANVYQPDWSKSERLEYTLRLARILNYLLPSGTEGSISTVPGGHSASGNAWGSVKNEAVSGGQDDNEQWHRAVLNNLLTCGLELQKMAAETDRIVRLALEPEPGCLWESVTDILKLYGAEYPAFLQSEAGWRSEAEGRMKSVISEYIGVCLDLCHQAVLFEEPTAAIEKLSALGVRIPKIQISAALACSLEKENISFMRSLAEPVYLHQSTLRHATGELEKFTDLSPALDVCDEILADVADSDSELRTHFHVPVCADTFAAGIKSTRDNFSKALIELALAEGTQHFEVETYTFDVLPEGWRENSVVDSISRELEWARRRMER